MKRLRIPLDPNDAVALVGLIALTIGAGLIYVPAAFVVVGSLLLIYAVLATRGSNP